MGWIDTSLDSKSMEDERPQVKQIALGMNWSCNRSLGGMFCTMGVAESAN